MNPIKSFALIYATFVIGGCSLILFYLFLFFGPFSPISLGMDKMQALFFDGFLCVLFFIQHSTLIRKNMRSRLERQIPAEYFGAFYTISSGFVLLVVTLLWQETFMVASFDGVAYWTLRAVFVLSVFGFFWCILSLGSFDPFGVRNIQSASMKMGPRPVALAMKGPYLWVRHPLYFLSLLMIWSFPLLTADRLLFNLLFTTWIIMATKLEEQDLLMDFGEEYRQYQAMVPMLIPYRLRSRIDGE